MRIQHIGVFRTFAALKERNKQTTSIYKDSYE